MAAKAKRASKTDRYFHDLPREKRALAQTLRSLVFEIEPNATEDLKWGQPWYGVKGGVCYIAAAKDHVKLGLWRGVELDDPASRIEGTGKGMRHIKIKDAGNINAPVKTILRAAFELDAQS